MAGTLKPNRYWEIFRIIFNRSWILSKTICRDKYGEKDQNYIFHHNYADQAVFDSLKVKKLILIRLVYHIIVNINRDHEKLPIDHTQRYFIYFMC